MDYDPTSDPRWIPPDTSPGQDPDHELVESRIADLSNAVDACRQMLDLFEHPGWTLVERLVNTSIADADEVLRKELDPLEWKFVRGQVVTYDWLLALPAVMRREMEQRITQIRRLQERIGEDVSA